MKNKIIELLKPICYKNINSTECLCDETADMILWRIYKELEKEHVENQNFVKLVPLSDIKLILEQ